jgi:hypothetical protein
LLSIVFLRPRPSNQAYDEKNIRRRVYDALNVLMAMNIITKEKKEIMAGLYAGSAGTAHTATTHTLNTPNTPNTPPPASSVWCVFDVTAARSLVMVICCDRWFHLEYRCKPLNLCCELAYMTGVMSIVLIDLILSD